jgi:hypothetical protein
MIPGVAGQNPPIIDQRKLRKVDLHHVAWTCVHAEAVMKQEFLGIVDAGQARILGESSPPPRDLASPLPDRCAVQKWALLAVRRETPTRGVAIARSPPGGHLLVDQPCTRVGRARKP